ncbi:MAG: hypothetical protein M3P96_12860 [Actinomycetota bacterium]|nr:hypothetical protein [Actinomycetota bacterium]
MTATTANGPNTWSAGTVAISDDDTGSAMFTATALRPNDTGNKCILVTYNGSLAASVKLYAAATGTLGTYLDLTVQKGTGGSFANCTGFTGAAIYTTRSPTPPPSSRATYAGWPASACRTWACRTCGERRSVTRAPWRGWR